MKNEKLDKWVELAANEPVPVLKHTIKELRQLCREEEIPLKDITHVVERDPSLVVHILRLSNERPKGRLSSEITHVNQAFRLMGTDQLTHLPDALPAVDDVLDEKQKKRLLATFSRAYHAARFATDWATLRADMTPDEVFTATQLHFYGEMILAIHAPDLLEKITTLRVKDHIASEEAQYMILGFTFNELTMKISERLKFPALIAESLSAGNAKFPRAYGIMLGVQLARNLSHEGWYSGSTLEIQEQIAEWIDITTDEVIARSHTIAAEIAREVPQYNTAPPARDLPLIIKIIPDEDSVTDSHDHTAICLIPQLELLKSAIQELITLSPKTISHSELIQHIISTMHDGIGLNRVVYCHYDEEEKLLEGVNFKGSENDPSFNRFKINVSSKGLFSHLLSKQQAVLMNASTREKFWPLVSKGFKELVGTNSFIAMSIYVKGKPVGLFYADRHTENCQIEDRSYSYFKKLCTHTSNILNQLR
ncbi:MAG: HDOD domain-containing protein [Woeseiaceae bacterium]